MVILTEVKAGNNVAETPLQVRMIGQNELA